MNPTAIFASMAFEARTLAHKAHLKTRSYAQHVALNEWYDGIVPLVDSLVEMYQGEFGVIEDYPDSGQINLPKEPIPLLLTFRNWCDTNKTVIAPSEDTQNVLQEIRGLTNQMLNKLQNLA